MSIFLYSGDRKYGAWFVHLFGYGLQLKAPWNKPLFSERQGFSKPVLQWKGWRLFYLKGWFGDLLE